MTITPDVNRRKSAFRTALAFADLTQQQWAADQGVTAGHLYAVLHGLRQSETLTAKIDAFIAEQGAAIVEAFAPAA